MLYYRSLIAFLLIISLNVSADTKSDAYNHLVYNFALIKQGINPSIVKSSFTKNIALEKVPNEFLPIYKEFLGLTDQLQFNFETIQKHESALAEQTKREQQEQIMSLAKKGAMAADLLGAGGAASSGLSFLSQFIYEDNTASTIITPESLREYRLNNQKTLSDFEFSLRLARKYSSNSDTLTLKDAELFVAIEKSYKTDSYSKLLELDARVKSFYPVKYNLAKLELAQKNIESSYNNFLASFEQLSEVTYNSEIKIDILEHLILTSIQLKKEEIATDHANMLATISPNNSFVHLIAGLKYLDQNKQADALHSLSEANKLSTGKPFIPLMTFAIQCQLKAFSDCHKSLLNIKTSVPSSLNSLRDKEVIIALQNSAPDLYTDIFGLSFSWAIDWHMINYDRLILTNTSAFKWTNIIAGSSYKESHSAQTFRPFENYWYSYGDLDDGKAIAINLTKSTKAALEYVDVQLKTDQGNISFRLQNLGGGKMKYLPLKNTGI